VKFKEFNPLVDQIIQKHPLTYLIVDIDENEVGSQNAPFVCGMLKFVKEFTKLKIMSTKNVVGQSTLNETYTI
jgi:hypothetical protein